MHEFKKSILVSIWFMFLTFPIMVIRVNTIENTVDWRWENLALIGIGSFVLSFVWRWALRRKEAGQSASGPGQGKTGLLATVRGNPRLSHAAQAAALALFLVIPWLVTTYQTNILISFLLYVILGLGLNIIVGVAGLLFLGHAAFSYHEFCYLPVWCFPFSPITKLKHYFFIKKILIIWKVQWQR